MLIAGTETNILMLPNATNQLKATVELGATRTKA